LAEALKLKNVPRDLGRYGIISSAKLIPETVNYKGMRIGRFEVTRAQFAQFDKSYKYAAGTDNFPANDVTFQQAKDYIAWLSEATGSRYRLVTEAEAKDIYDVDAGGENTLDRWAGYSINPDDAVRLEPIIEELGAGAPLLKEVGSFTGRGSDELVFDLGGNVAEWVLSTNNSGRAYGGSADMPSDPKIPDRKPAPQYIGFRVVKEIGGK